MDDTSAIAGDLQAAFHRRLTGTERLHLAFDMSLAARRLASLRLRLEHPEWSDKAVTAELLRYAFAVSELPPPLR